MADLKDARALAEARHQALKPVAVRKKIAVLHVALHDGRKQAVHALEESAPRLRLAFLP